VKLGHPDWSLHSHSLAYSVACRNDSLHFYAILNAYWEPLEFELPPAGKSDTLWRRWIDTSLDSPCDIVEWQVAPAVVSPTYRAEPRSVVVLHARAPTPSESLRK
jgi:isoamylase